MKVGLIDVDRLTFTRQRFPNLALMKISGWHKAHGDTVTWCTNPMERFDLVYMSKVFDETYVPDIDWIPNADEIVKGGGGYEASAKLPDEVEHAYPDYALYEEIIPSFRDTAIGYLTRGCPRNCPWCVVASIEGRTSRKVANLEEFWHGQKHINLMDPNLLACRKDRMDLLDQLARSEAWVNFSQGLDIRFMTNDVADLLNKIKVERFHFAWDNPKEDLRQYLDRFAERSRIKDHRRKIVYILTNYNSSHEEDLYRVYEVERRGYDADVRIYDKPHAPLITLRLQRWCNNRFVHGACPRFEDYTG